MNFAFSPSRDPGGTLHLSPAHLRHVDSVSAIKKQLRRSLSRSPSKPYLTVSRSSSHSPSSPSSSTIGLSLRSMQESVNPDTSFQQETLGLSFPPSAKKFRPNLRRTTPLRILTTATTTPSRIPVRRGLSDSSDQGNASPASMRRYRTSVEGQENSSSSVSPEESQAFESIGDIHPLKFSLSVKADCLFPPQSKSVISSTRESGRPTKSSPLKRSDGIMNLDRAYHGTPSVKRKSVCGGFTSSPFDIARDDDVPPDMDEDNTMDESDDEDAAHHTIMHSPLAPRFTSLRKSTLQHRTSEKSPAFRTRRSIDGASDVSKSPKAQVKGRPRTSLDSALPTNSSLSSHTPRDFEPRSSDIPRVQFSKAIRPNPHPLSQALSPISPSPQRQNEVGVAEAPRFQIPAMPVINFSKSLPIGALRPHTKATLSKESQRPFVATPEAYKIARPDPAAFRSTGLISKRHRNPDDLPAPPANQVGMPDTPCKKFPVGFSFPTSPTPVNTVAKSRFAQPAFGTPSKPFNPYQASGTPASFGKSTNVFGSSFHRGNARRESFASIDGEEILQSPTLHADSQSSADELPPTPTKQASGVSMSKPPSLRSSLFGRHPSIGPNTFQAPEASEQQALQPCSLFSQPTRPSGQPRSSPKTPGDMGFPDPSSLSISPRNYCPVSPVLNAGYANVSALPPETPTHKDGMVGLANALMTPSNHGVAQDVDPTLIAKFKKVEPYGKGEFSEVYKVYGNSETVSPHSYFNSSFGSGSSQAAAPQKIWIVKKSKAAYTSVKARERKLTEVMIMKSLGKSDNVVHLVDSWEARYHLYIQTEFCEEGDLEAFLACTGNKGRLDDFRIWKIMIELCNGIKHIHDSGFIHLDLKPANIFIDFEGVLKIGDFGMASQWPAPSDVEGEGDRRYIGPDLLQGRFDKPADIFALGMMMFEIAGNCIPPDNGASWQQLRSGDWSGLPSLTCGSSNSMNQNSREELMDNHSFENLADLRVPEPMYESKSHHTLSISDLPRLPPSSVDIRSRIPPHEEDNHAPKFMSDPEDESALDRIVHWMMLPNPSDRPVVDQILGTNGVKWVDSRRRAGAIIYEGPWGPPSYVLKFEEPEDEEMLDAP